VCWLYEEFWFCFIVSVQICIKKVVFFYICAPEIHCNMKFIPYWISFSTTVRTSWIQLYKHSKFTPRTVLKFQLERLGFWLFLVKCFVKIPKEYPPSVFLEIIPYFFPTVDLQCHDLLTQIRTFQVWMCNFVMLLPEGGSYFKQWFS